MDVYIRTFWAYHLRHREKHKRLSTIHVSKSPGRMCKFKEEKSQYLRYRLRTPDRKFVMEDKPNATTISERLWIRQGDRGPTPSVRGLVNDRLDAWPKRKFEIIASHVSISKSFYTRETHSIVELTVTANGVTEFDESTCQRHCKPCAWDCAVIDSCAVPQYGNILVINYFHNCAALHDGPLS